MSLLTYTNFNEEVIMRFLDESVNDIKIAFKAYSEYKKAYISIFTRFLIGIIVLVFTAFFIGRFVILEKYFQFDKIIRLTLMLPIPLILPLYFAVLTLSYVLIVVILISMRIYNTTILKTKAKGNESNLLGSS